MKVFLCLMALVATAAAWAPVGKHGWGKNWGGVSDLGLYSGAGWNNGWNNAGLVGYGNGWGYNTGLGWNGAGVAVAAPVTKVLSAQVVAPAPVISHVAAPVISHVAAPIVSHVSAPVVSHVSAPLIAAPTIVRAAPLVASAPVVKVVSAPAVYGGYGGAYGYGDVSHGWKKTHGLW